MKKIILFIWLTITILQTSRADSPCAASGNVFRRSSLALRPGRINVSLDNNCAVVMPNMKPIYIAGVTRAGWRMDSITQSPAIGTTIYPLSAGSCPDGITRLLTMKAYFRNTRLTSNPRDDQFCEMTIIDTMVFEDKTRPTSRSIFITTPDPVFEPSHLKSHFGSSVLSDNCSNLSVLQNNIEFEPSSTRPLYVPILCILSSNTYRVRYRTRDLCGNHSDWSVATVTFIDTIKPIVSSISGSSDLILNNTCNTTILRSQFSVTAADDQTPRSNITLSYRVISPLSLAGNISVTGKTIDAHGICPPENIISVRICAQDCSGNGNLHSADNEVTSNCLVRSLTLRDTTAPALTGTLSPVSLPVNINTCTAEMPNLAFLLSGSDHCSDVSIYQLPAPGSILNNGVLRAPGLARGVPRVFTCELLKEPDTIINCINPNGIFKSLQVSFLVVDCYGNCTIRRFPGIVKLTNIPLPMDIKMNQINTKNIVASQTLSVQNYPNPFNESTQIRIVSDDESEGKLRFNTIQGHEIWTKELTLHKGINTVRVDKSEINHTGIIYFSLESSNKITGEISRVNSRMVIF